MSSQYIPPPRYPCNSIALALLERLIARSNKGEEVWIKHTSNSAEEIPRPSDAERSIYATAGGPQVFMLNSAKADAILTLCAGQAAQAIWAGITNHTNPNRPTKPTISKDKRLVYPVTVKRKKRFTMRKGVPLAFVIGIVILSMVLSMMVLR